jgi:hypothetical protein
MNEKQSFDDKLMEAAGALETEVAPERDLWPDIENAIARPSRGRWNRVFAQAAAVVLLAGASSGLTYLAMGNRTPSRTTPHVNTAPLQIDQASFGDTYMLGPDYQEARNSLRARFEEQLEQLAPEARAEVTRNVDAIRSVIEEINRALSNDPDNALLQELLLSTYQDELSLMMKVDGVTNAAMSRTDF